MVCGDTSSSRPSLGISHPLRKTRAKLGSEAEVDPLKRTQNCPRNQKPRKKPPSPQDLQKTKIDPPKRTQKLDSRRQERSGHDDGQDKVATREGKKKEKTTPLITSFTAINESNDENENKTEDSTGTISPLLNDSKPELYDDHNKPTRAETQYAIVAKDEGVEISEESEEDVEVEPVNNQVVETSVVHSELDYDQEEV